MPATENKKRATACTAATGERKKPRVDTKAPSQLHPYTDLDRGRKEFRLLVVEPGSESDPVQCEFQQAFLTDDPIPAYETISYVWGDAKIRSSVLLRGNVFDVPISSERALRHMRLPDKSRILWIDAVCIDQKNIKERSHQVQIMGDIFLNTKTNLIWMGSADSGSTASALSSLQLIFDEMRLETDNFQNLTQSLYSSGRHTMSSKKGAPNIDEAALIRFFTNPWITRLWVCQEASLAPRNICHVGQHKISLHKVLHAVLWICYRLSYPPELRALVRNAWNLASWQKYGYNCAYPNANDVLLNLLRSFQDFRAKDPRDHVFAILGLLQTHSSELNKDIPAELTPDYNAPLAQVYANAARCSIRQLCELECLRFVSHRMHGEKIDGLPTWAPRWDRPWDAEQDPSLFWYRGQKADGAADFDLDLALSQDAGVLLTKGHIVDKVTRMMWTIGPRENSAVDVLAFLKLAERMVELLLNEPEDLSGRLGEVLKAGPTFIRNISDAAHVYAAFRSHIAEKMALPNVETASKSIIDFFEAMKKACGFRKLFTVEGGQFGLGPQTMQEGDVVAVLYGSRFPVVLRASIEHVGDYECIGDAYVYGIMDGEAVREADAEAEVLRLR